MQQSQTIIYLNELSHMQLAEN